MLAIAESGFWRNGAGVSGEGLGGAIMAHRAVALDLSVVSFVANRAFGGAAIACCGGRVSHVSIEKSKSEKVT